MVNFNMVPDIRGSFLMLRPPGGRDRSRSAPTRAAVPKSSRGFKTITPLKGTGPVQHPNSGQIFTFGNYFEHRGHGMGRLSGP